MVAKYYIRLFPANTFSMSIPDCIRFIVLNDKRGRSGNGLLIYIYTSDVLEHKWRASLPIKSIVTTEFIF